MSALDALNAARASLGLALVAELPARRSLAGRLRALEGALGGARVRLEWGARSGGCLSARLPSGGRLGLGSDALAS
ncbi:MAG TPA: hypothetical protein VNS09_07290 [Solirubrobacter sp.]|nr:hypothetical protein [Solirubrobacter sp.]